MTAFITCLSKSFAKRENAQLFEDKTSRHYIKPPLDWTGRLHVFLFRGKMLCKYNVKEPQGHLWQNERSATFQKLKAHGGGGCSRLNFG